MHAINIYVGLNVQDLKFECGGGELGFEPGIVRHYVAATSRPLIESKLHPQKIAQKVVDEINYCTKHWDLHISTHSDIPLNVIGLMINMKKIDASLVKVFILSDDNSQISQVSTYNPDGYLENWPYGFMDYNFQEIKNVL